jgi:hypothetical protein
MNPNPTARPPVSDSVHVLVVIDHRMARIYKADLHETAHDCIIPYDANGLGRHLHYVQNESNGQQQAARKSFYDAVAKTLQSAKRILLFGCDTGSGNAMEQLFTELKRNYQALARRVVGSVVVNEPHLTENQLLAKARAYHAGQRLLQPGDIDETLN